MSSNTSTGKAQKGSRYWMQTIINNNNGSALTKAIQAVEKTISDITWLSPVSSNNYKELRTHQINGIGELDFWPDNGPWWDAVGKDSNGIIILVEAKGHISETYSKCGAKADQSVNKIASAIEYTHRKLSSSQFDQSVWLDRYYQLANRLAFLVYLRKKGLEIRLVLLNFVNDYTHIKTSEDEWSTHYKDIFKDMIGTSNPPKDVLIVNIDANNIEV